MGTIDIGRRGAIFEVVNTVGSVEQPERRSVLTGLLMLAMFICRVSCHSGCDVPVTCSRPRRCALSPSANTTAGMDGRLSTAPLWFLPSRRLA
jgi:hypothetical protein